MSQSRRERIEAMLRDDPDDTFLRYSLALEMESAGDWEPCLEILEALGRGSTPYVPALQMAGQFLAARGRVEDARRALREGIEAARSQGNLHAAGEMADLLMSLGDASSA